MTTTYRSRADQRAADEADAGIPQQLMCAAHGCPNRWSTSDGHLCRWHAEADRMQWPLITQQQQWDETERARLRGNPKPFVQPLSFADKRAILARLRALPATMRDQEPKAWAHALKAREERGERLNPTQKSAWRNALHSTQETAE